MLVEENDVSLVHELDDVVRHLASLFLGLGLEKFEHSTIGLAATQPGVVAPGAYRRRLRRRRRRLDSSLRMSLRRY